MPEDELQPTAEPVTETVATPDVEPVQPVEGPTPAETVGTEPTATPDEQPAA